MVHMSEPTPVLSDGSDAARDVIVLGSTTMHQSAAFLDSEMPIPVLNPGQVAYKMLETQLELGLTHSKKAFPAPEVPATQDIRKGWY